MDKEGVIVRLKPNGDGTITDTKTGLIWQADPFASLAETDKLRFLLTTGNPEPLDSHEFTWQEATDYASCLSLADHDDWRLPTKDELFGLFECLKRSQWRKLFPNIQMNFYWSSTTDAGHTGYAWFVYFGNGTVSVSPKSYGNYVRCVRGG